MQHTHKKKIRRGLVETSRVGWWLWRRRRLTHCIVHTTYRHTDIHTLVVSAAAKKKTLSVSLSCLPLILQNVLLIEQNNQLLYDT